MHTANADGSGHSVWPTPEVSSPGRVARLHLPRGREAAIDHSLVVFPALVTVWLFLRYVSAHQIAVDFNHDFWWPGCGRFTARVHTYGAGNRL
jgi:hypothetical protein